MPLLTPENYDGTPEARKVLKAIIEECDREKIFLGTVNAREIIIKHIDIALAEKSNGTKVSRRSDRSAAKA